MINIEQFWERHINLELLNKWRSARDLKPVLEADLPKTGLMVFDNDKQVACGFLRNAEGIGMIDSVVSNPDMPSKARDEALNTIFLRLLAIAKMKDFRTVFGTSQDDHTILRSEKFGFKKSAHVVMALSLKGD